MINLKWFALLFKHFFFKIQSSEQEKKFSPVSKKRIKKESMINLMLKPSQKNFLK